ncbi:putative methyltransferase-domain-containing protein [Echria macrotheca]|uniref:Methyltransferase-domain-containing protein n=1 Tax=Echria macrotheca TaxID=438768 RepID=A0AAJ0F4V5_9PEZI|nr:putative methyltransferase-domain-containing protein [Echria macrotheca]
MRGGPPESAPLPTGSPPTGLTHLWQKPTFADLLACLQQLRVEPPVWNLKASRAEILQKQEEQQHAVDAREIVSFLSVIIKSSLAWLDDDDEREQIWDEASKRLAERCGRTAMGEITRRWPFESPDESGPGSFTLTIREPALTGDSLGLKTWGSSYVLARLLPSFSSPSGSPGGPGPLAHLLSVEDASRPPILILELGSGTGLLGLAAAATWRCPVVLTDLPTIVPNLSHNAAQNRAIIEARGGSVETVPLTWGDTSHSDPRFVNERYKLIVVADPLYDDDHPALLASAIDAQLDLGTEARVLVMVPERDDVTRGLLRMFRLELGRTETPLCCVQEGTVAGEDDWGNGDDDDDARQVGFWWGIFKRDDSR